MRCHQSIKESIDQFQKYNTKDKLNVPAQVKHGYPMKFVIALLHTMTKYSQMSLTQHLLFVLLSSKLTNFCSYANPII